LILTDPLIEKFKMPSWSARNPLGIVALFISLIYGMSALLLGTSINALSPINQTILVIFIVTFPFVVLGVFGWLVARHHMKLYGPSDYRTDKSFLDALGTLPPSEVGKRLQREVAESNDPQITSGDVDPTSSDRRAQDSKSAIINLAAGSGKSFRLKQAFMNEALVFQALQDEFRGSVRRNVRLPNGREIDGIIETGDGSIVVVEVKFIGSATRNVADVFYTIERQVNRIAADFSSLEYAKRTRIVVALVIDGDPKLFSRANDVFEKYRKRIQAMAELRLYSVQELFDAYGFPADSAS
jgi:Holliday junction resolvase-like predicted endonuclease